MAVMLEKRPFTDVSSSPPEVQSDSEFTDTAGVLLIFGGFPFLADLADALFLGGILDSACC